MLNKFQHVKQVLPDLYIFEKFQQKSKYQSGRNVLYFGFIGCLDIARKSAPLVLKLEMLDGTTQFNFALRMGISLKSFSHQLNIS